MNNNLNKILKYSIFAFSLLLFAFLVLLYQFPYEKLIKKVTSNLKYEVNFEEASYKPVSKLSIKNISIPSANENSRILFKADEVILNLYLASIFKDTIQTEISTEAYDGKIDGLVSYDLSERSLKDINLKLGKINIEKYPVLTALVPFKLEGFVSGELNINSNNSNIEGKGNIVLDGPVRISNVEYQGINLPDLEFDEIVFIFNLKNNVISIDKLDLKGKTVLAKISGNILLDKELFESNADLTIWVSPSDETPQEIKNMIALFSGAGQKEGIKFKIEGPVNSLEFTPML